MGIATDMKWQPATVEEVKEIVRRDLAECNDEQIQTFESFSIDPFKAVIVRYEQTERVVVVARRGDEVMYWDDVEEGFNISPVTSDGQILQHFCNQDSLGLALNAWIKAKRDVL
jgi:hypothetical protein